jgi:prepilin-type N-terminal cleavage/methylation domain-containing protein
VRNERGFTLVELLVVTIIVAVLLAISVVLYRGARVRGGESAAIGTLNSINQAQFAYMQTCGNQRYAPTLASLGIPIPRGGSPYLSPDLTTGETVVKGGYSFQMSGTPVMDGSRTCTDATPVVGYQVTAEPTVPGLTGLRYFGTNTDRVIYEGTETFLGNMPESGPPDRGSEITTVRAR